MQASFIFLSSISGVIHTYILYLDLVAYSLLSLLVDLCAYWVLAVGFLLFSFFCSLVSRRVGVSTGGL